MSHADDFAAPAGKTQSKFTKIDSAVLCYKTTAGLDMYHYYDFIARTVLVRVEQKEHINVITFANADAQTLSFMHGKLIELGGTPPPLPEPENAPFSPIRKGPQQ